MDKLTALRVFQRVVERGSFSAAARELRLSNAAVSKNVRELEQELGAQLLQRTTRSLRLTAAGEGYFRQVVGVLEQLEQADESAKEQTSSTRGRLRVAAPMSFGLAELMVPVADFAKRYPAISIEVEMNDRYVDVVREGFDVAIRGSGPLPDSNLVAKRLIEIERLACASPAYLARAGEPKAPRQLAQHQCLIYSLASAPDTWTFRKGKSRSSVRVQSALTVNSSLALATAAEEGVGIALLPTFAATEGLRTGRLRRLLHGWSSEPQALHALYPRHNHTSYRVRLFVDHLCQRFRPT